ncbi:unnamed protein product [Spirodela intermedia]|uniref:Prolamin-like domain-containing protein n=1 Tax=Spirodela intermedia TaxID=51605 RepID=A0A7I8LBL4_SPIIN|nr:unnamed protein product [Spirodela intermedia]
MRGSKLVGVVALLLACTAATCTVSHAGRTSAPAPAPTTAAAAAQQLGLPGLPILPPIFGGGGATDPDLLQCVKSLLGAADCVTGLLGSLISGKIDLTAGCCDAIDGLSERCFSEIFAVPVFGSVFPGMVKSFCASPVPGPPSD